MQPPLMYSWIALTASAPVILLTCWTLAIFQCRRRQWGTMDIFLVAILSQSIFQQFLGFVYSTLVLLKLSTPLTGEAVCTGMMWFFIVIPIFKGTTITSLGEDYYCDIMQQIFHLWKKYNNFISVFYSISGGSLAILYQIQLSAINKKKSRQISYRRPCDSCVLGWVHRSHHV